MDLFSESATGVCHSGIGERANAASSRARPLATPAGQVPPPGLKTSPLHGGALIRAPSLRGPTWAASPGSAACRPVGASRRRRTTQNFWALPDIGTGRWGWRTADTLQRPKVVSIPASPANIWLLLGAPVAACATPGDAFGSEHDRRCDQVPGGHYVAFQSSPASQPRSTLVAGPAKPGSRIGASAPTTRRPLDEDDPDPRHPHV